MSEYIVRVRVTQEYKIVVNANDEYEAAEIAELDCIKYGLQQWQETEAVSVEFN